MTLISYVTILIYVLHLLRHLEGLQEDKMDDTAPYQVQLRVTGYNLLHEASFGTRTCIPLGNTTIYEGALGHFRHLDSCCQKHFRCAHVEPGETDHRATNNGLYMSYHCDCEENLMRCLKKKVTTATEENISDEEVARILNFGRVYFNEYGIFARCFRKTPYSICNTYYLWLNSFRCAEYSYLSGYGKHIYFFHLPIWGDVPVDDEHSFEAIPPHAPVAPYADDGSWPSYVPKD